MPYVVEVRKLMRSKSEIIGKCPNCGHEAVASQFLERDNTKHWSGLVTSSMRIRCPSCGAKLKFKYGRLQLASTFFLFGALIIVIAFFPEYISHFAYSVGAIYFIYLLQRFGYLQRFDFFKNIFSNEFEEK